jgi:conjugative transfer region protein TrbK
MRGCLLSLGCMGLLISFGACGTGITAGIYRFVHHQFEDKQLPFGTYALKGELHRCRDLGVAAYRDITCEAAWTAERRQDLGCATAAAPQKPGVR